MIDFLNVPDDLLDTPVMPVHQFTVGDRVRVRPVEGTYTCLSCDKEHDFGKYAGVTGSILGETHATRHGVQLDGWLVRYDDTQLGPECRQLPKNVVMGCYLASELDLLDRSTTE